LKICDNQALSTYKLIKSFEAFLFSPKIEKIFPFALSSEYKVTGRGPERLTERQKIESQKIERQKIERQKIERRKIECQKIERRKIECKKTGPDRFTDTQFTDSRLGNYRK
jgi:hypothetical protein